MPSPDRPETIQTMFGDIAPHYDRANTVLSFGLHHLWRRKTVKMSEVGPGDEVLDCACGTGDLALAYKRQVGLNGRVIATDFCEPMLELARRKAMKKRLDIEMLKADVLDLPFEKDRFECSSIAFGIRSIEDKVGCLKEMARVVAPGGRVVVLETGQPPGRLMAPFYRWYSKHIMPRLGGWLSGHPEAYRYLPESSARMPCGAEFEELMKATGSFDQLLVKQLTRGVTWLYIGIVAK